MVRLPSQPHRISEGWEWSGRQLLLSLKPLCPERDDDVDLACGGDLSIDWGQAVSYFGQVAPHLPNLRDKSGMTAADRYHTALINYGYLLAEQGLWCKSAQQFQL